MATTTVIYHVSVLNVTGCRYGFKIVVWRTSGRDLRWHGRTTQRSTLTFSTQRQHSTHSTLRLSPSRLHQLLSIDRQTSSHRRSSTTLVWDFRELPPPTVVSQRPTSNSFPSLQARISPSAIQRLQHLPSDHRLSSRIPPPVKVTVQVTGSPDSAHAPHAVQLFPVYSRQRLVLPCRLVCSNRTSLTLKDRHRTVNDNDQHSCVYNIGRLRRINWNTWSRSFTNDKWCRFNFILESCDKL